MFVIRTRLLILALMLGGAIVFVVQNQELVSLVFFGKGQTFQLPIAVWILLFSTAGALTSLFLQFLNFQQRPTQLRRYAPEPKPYSPRSRRQETTQERDRPSDARQVPTPKPTPTPAAESDWETTGEKGDWNTEESAPESTAKRENFDRSLKEDESKTFEVKQEPKTASRSGSVYSYGYREPKDKGVGKTEQVYDANYRVITPPYRQNAEQQTDEDESDQDWI